MTPSRHRPHHKCPWFLTGLAIGLLTGTLCIQHGMSSADHTPAPISSLPR